MEIYIENFKSKQDIIEEYKATAWSPRRGHYPSRVVWVALREIVSKRLK